MANDSQSEAAARAAEILPGIYAAASEPARWPEALQAVAGLLDASCGLLFSHQAAPEQRGLWVAWRISPEETRRYVEHYHAHDIWMQRGHALKVWVPGRVVVGADLLADRAFLDSLFYREFLAPQDIRDVCAGVLHDGSEAGIPRVHVAVYRTHARPRFGAADKAVMTALMPHLREATRIGFRLAELEHRLHIARAAADTILPALVLADRSGRIVFANRPARILCAGGDGLRLKEGRLEVAAARLQSQLDKLLAQAGAQSTALQVPRASGKPAFWLIPVELPASEGAPPDARRPSKALLIHDPATQGANLQDFAVLHRLTPAEAKLLEALLIHSMLSDAARHLGVSINTVRSQLRSILDKCGVHRQVELMRMVASWPRRGRRAGESREVAS